MGRVPRRALAAVAVVAMIAGACTDGAAPRPQPASGARPLDRTERGAIAGFAGSTTDGVTEIASRRVDDLVLALVQQETDDGVALGAYALRRDGDTYDVAYPAPLAEDAARFLRSLPRPGSGATDLVLLRPEGARIWAGFVDPTFTRVATYERGEVLDTASPARHGAVFVVTSRWAQLRFRRGGRLAGASLMGGKLERPRGALDGAAAATGRELVRRLRRGEEVSGLLAGAVPRHVGADLAALLQESGVDTAGATAGIRRHLVRVRFGREPLDSGLDLYMTRERGAWRVYLYSFFSGFRQR